MINMTVDEKPALPVFNATKFVQTVENLQIRGLLNRPKAVSGRYSPISSASWIASASAATSCDTLRRSICERIPALAVDAETDALEISSAA